MVDSTKVIVEPHKRRFDATVTDPVILSPVGPITSAAALFLRARKKIKPFPPAKVYSIKRDGKEISLVGPCMSSPVAVMTLEQCIAQGVRNVILLGLCGSINPDVGMGEFVVATSALSEEGTSSHYDPKSNPPRAGEIATAAVKQAFDQACIEYHEGRVWTTDAIYRETEDKVRQYGEQGLLAVEMELSALFTVGRYRGIQVGAVMVVSDELFEMEWRPGFTNPEVLGATRVAMRMALNAATILSDKNQP